MGEVVRKEKKSSGSKEDTWEPREPRGKVAKMAGYVGLGEAGGKGREVQRLERYRVGVRFASQDDSQCC